jgi:hypothetical protein
MLLLLYKIILIVYVQDDTKRLAVGIGIVLI